MKVEWAPGLCMNGKIQYATSIVNLVERLLKNLSKVWLNGKLI